MNEEAASNNNSAGETAHERLNLKHTYNYIGGYYAYKNSSKQQRRLDPQSLQETVLLTKPGQAQRLMMAFHEDLDERAGNFPQHNSPESFREGLELLPAKTLKPYTSLCTIEQIEKDGFKHKIASMTKDRLSKIRAQFMHLEDFAFNQMMDIPRPDKRDFDVWYKSLASSNQMMIAYPHVKTGEVLFIQVIKYDDQGRIHAIRHTTFGEGEPLVINESCVDKYGNLRQIAHMGAKSGSKAVNSVERFDDGTVMWIISKEKISGAAGLRADGVIELMPDDKNPSAVLSARNLGAEGVEDGEWTGELDHKALTPDCNAMQESFKQQVRGQIDQIIDGATIPGLDPIFWVTPD